MSFSSILCRQQKNYVGNIGKEDIEKLKKVEEFKKMYENCKNYQFYVRLPEGNGVETAELLTKKLKKLGFHVDSLKNEPPKK